MVAVSSPSSGQRVIVRITGPDTIQACNRIFNGPISVKSRTTDNGRRTRDERRETSLLTGNIAVDGELKVEAKLYLFLAPHSYTGDDVAEIHIHTSPAVTEALMDNLLYRGLRMAGPGEFTARAYLNGKIDLAQAEAVNEIVVSSNKFQLAAAEKLLAGRLAETTAKVRASLMESLSLIEAGLDFSGEDIELGPHFAKNSQNENPFITQPEAIERLVKIRDQLEQLLAGSIRYESVIDLLAVGIAGAHNAGKSSLVNKLLGKERSIVSHRRKTTRDVLTGLLTLAHCRCVLFDCAGLTCDSSLPRFRGPQDALRRDKFDPAEARACRSGNEQRTILDELAQQAAIEALRNSAVVVFCVDISQDPRRKSQDSGSWTEEIGLWSLVWSLGSPGLIPVATKCDLVSEQVLSERLAELNELFGFELLVTSTETGIGIELLRNTIDRKILDSRFSMLDAGSSVLEKRAMSIEHQVSGVALTARHRQLAGEAIENISESINELQAGNDEVAAMMLRAAYQGICDIESATGGPGQIDEQILEKIFGRFCIGK
ncbi:MAG: tRNA modification GTPase [Planctomycetota bacterium]